MSKPIFEDLFKFSGRRNRKSYLLLQLSAWLVIVATTLAAIGLIAVVGDGTIVAGAIFAVQVAVILATVSAAWISSAQRVRDFGHSGWWAVTQLIPYIGFVIGLVIAFVPSNAGENRYGPSCI